MKTTCELDLVKAAASGKESAMRALIEQYEPLIHKNARKYGWMAPAHSYDDLVQEGRIGIVNAVRKFDPTRGVKFMTHAFHHVRGAVQSRARKEFRHPRFTVSIEDQERAYNIPDSNYTNLIIQRLGDEKVREIVEKCCKGGLESKRAQIVMDRFGLLGRKELRHGEVAEKHGITKQNVTAHVRRFAAKARELYPELQEWI